MKTATLHSNRSQNQRLRALKDFKSGAVRVLVATDIAARGIDVDDISHVVNYDFPMHPEDYVHRIGRTGRAHAVGDAISFVTPEDHSELRSVHWSGSLAAVLSANAPKDSIKKKIRRRARSGQEVGRLLLPRAVLTRSRLRGMACHDVETVFAPAVGAVARGVKREIWRSRLFAFLRAINVGGRTVRGTITAVSLRSSASLESESFYCEWQCCLRVRREEPLRGED